jgi:hypothetical protein
VWATATIFKKLAKLSNKQMGEKIENSPNLVTLISSDFLFVHFLVQQFEFCRLALSALSPAPV